MRSFGPPRRFAPQIEAAGVPQDEPALNGDKYRAVSFYITFRIRT